MPLSVSFFQIAAGLIAAAIAVATFGSTHGTILTGLTGGRVYCAMAKDGLFFQSAATVHPLYRTPHVSLWWQGLWSAVVALSGTYDQPFTYAMFAAILMYAAATAAVFTLRRQQPDLPRPYRTWGYPVIPIAYLGALFLLAVTTIRERPVESLAGLAVLATECRSTTSGGAGNGRPIAGLAGPPSDRRARSLRGK